MDYSLNVTDANLIKNCDSMKIRNVLKLPGMKYSKAHFIFLCTVLSLIFPVARCLANNISISNTKLTAQNTTANIVKIEFSVSWENSFRVSAGPANWDAAWIFVKYRVAAASGGDGLWRHATLNTTGQIIPSGSVIKMTPEGAIVYRAANGNGTFSVNGAGVYWNYGTHVEAGTNDFIDDDDAIEIKVFGIEMVYVPGGQYNAGGGGGPTAFTSTNITTANASLIGTGFPTGQTNNNALFPNGFNAFYCMKYEISQQQYVDFLNTLTKAQQFIYTTGDPTFPTGSAALYSLFLAGPQTGNYNRNGIDVELTSIGDNPATYSCNLDGDNIFSESNDGQWLACNFLYFSDWLGYLDWSGLRPMTELEYEKACRGNLPPVAGEFAWGNTSFVAIQALSNAGTMTESAGSPGANVNLTNGAVIDGPVRVGIFATSVSSRALSGATYYGLMEMTGNVGDMVVYAGPNPTYTGIHGNGKLGTDGYADALNWPGAVLSGGSRGLGIRGWPGTTTPNTVSYRGDPISVTTDNRSAALGGRGVRTAPL
jgi:formylglycine-generating enzyme required for sulfatase activity